MRLPQLESDSLFQHAFLHAKIGMAVVGLNGRFWKVNPSLCKLTGYSEAELVRMTLSDITHPADAPLGERMRSMLIEGKLDDYQNEKRYIRKDGIHIWVQISVSVIRDEAGFPIVFVTQLQDISDRKRAEFQLQRHMQQYKSLFDENPDIVFAVSMDGEVTSLNESAERITGYSAEQWRERIPILFKDSIRHALEHANEGSLRTFRLEKTVPRKDGGFVHLSVKHAPIIVDGEAVGIYGIAKDITKQTTLLRQIKESEKKYRLLAENSLDVIARINPFGVFTYVSPSSKAVLGYTPEELIGVDSMSLVHPEDVKRLISLYQSSGGEFDEQITTCRYRTKTGSYVWIEGRTKAIRGKRSGKITEYLTAVRDVTEREIERTRLEEREEMYRDIVEHSPDAIVISAKGKIAYVNETAVSLFGATEKSQLLGMDTMRLIHPDCRERALARTRQVEIERSVAELYQTVFIRLDGSLVDVEVKSIPTVYFNTDAIHTIVRDVTERKKTQEVLQQSEKLSAAGQLAAGIAHEIRNPLTSLKGFLHLIQSGEPKPSYYRIMKEELNRVESILRELLLLAKPNGAVTKSHDLNRIVRSVASLLETQANLRDIELSLRLPASPLPIRGDDNQLKQVFINFVKNAIEAMPEGGKVEIAAAAAEGKAVLSFADQGHGIPEEKLPFIGRPFFTTKEYGTGLGLSVSYQIIEAHRGTVAVRSVVGEGTTFTISLPLA